MEKMIFAVVVAAFLCFGGTKRRNWLIQFALASAFLLALTTPRVSAQVQNDDHNPVGVTGAFEGVIQTGCGYNVLNHSTSRAIDDIVVPGSIGKYPLKMTRYYTSRRYGANGLGPGWSYEYLWQLSLAGFKVTSPQGDVHDFSCGRPLGTSEGWDDGIQGQHQNGGIWRLADGGKVNFESNYLATYIEDPYGQRTTIEYTNGYPTKVTEPGGRYLKLIWGDSQLYTMGLLLTRVEAHGLGNATVTDWVNYTYTAKPTGGTTYTQMKVLTSVTYSDNTSATYAYEADNAPDQPNQNSYKMYPLVSTCNDVRYKGPMRRIAYDYQSGGPHGAITAERYSPNDGAKGVAVSSISPGLPSPISQPVLLHMPADFTETRGDGPARAFHYTDLAIQRPTECCDRCPDFTGPAPTQFLESYTDFQNHTTQLGYDGNWYVNSVTDANTHTTSYQRGPAPVGEILRITHPAPDSSYIQYGYQDHRYLTSIIDERGNQTVHTRDANHRITHTDYKDASNNILAYETFTYNGFGQVLTHRLKNGAYESLAYDSRGLLTDKWNPKQNAVPSGTDPHTHYTYYTSGPWTDRVLTMTLPANVSGYPASETYEYDRNSSGAAVAGRGLVTKITHADGKYQAFGYDAFGNKLWEENELRQRTSYTYDNYNRVLTVTRVMSPAPNETTIYTYNPTNGTGTSPYLHTTNNPDTVTTPTTIVMTNDYDQNFRKTSASVGGQATWFHYDAAGNQDWLTDPRGTAGRTWPNGDPAYTTYTDYDSRNRKWRVREPLGRTTEFHYDDGINLTRIIRPDQTTETKAYDGMNRVLTDTVPQTSTVNLTTTFVYNPSGTIYKIIDPNGGNEHSTWFTYNASDEKIGMIYSGQTQSQAWTYDNAHNLASRTTVHGAPETQRFGYDNRNRKITMRWDNNADWANFSYDDAGRLWVAANANSTVSRAYDAAGRVYWERQNIASFGIKDVRYEHNADGNQTRLYVVNTTYDYTFSYDPMGRFEKIFAPGVTNPVWQYTYDPASNETARLNLYDGVAQTYGRDALNRMSRRDIKKGATTISYEAYTYDAMSRLRTVTREDNKQDQFTYYWDGELSTAQYGATPAPTPTPTPTSTPAPTPTPTPPPGQVATPTFRPDGVYYSACAYSYTFSVIISTTTSGAQISYTTDGSTPTPTHGTVISNSGTASVFVQTGQTKTLKAIGFKTGMTNSSVHSANYSFDRECGQVPPPEAPETIRTVGYYLDKAGNRTSVTDTVNGNATYTPNALNQYDAVTGSSITNGSEHEISTYQNVSYTYINDEHLTRASDGTNTYDLYYDALGRCVKRTLNGVDTYYIYDGEKPILEYNPSGGQVGWNVYGKGIDEILQRIAYPSSNYFVQQDHEGSVTHLTNTSGTVLEKYRYDAFGKPTIYNGSGVQISATAYDNRFLFTGREYAATYQNIYIPAFAFYEYRARAYHPGLGRFMSEDPKLFDPGDYNLFRYCHNDPVDFTDPMGTQDERREPWYNHQEQAKAIDREYDYIMAAAQMNSSDGAIGVAALASTMTLQLHANVMNYSEAAGLQTGAVPRGSNSFSDKPQALVLNGQPVWDPYAQKWVLVPPHVSLDKNIAQAKQMWPSEWVPKVWRNGEWDYKRQGPFRDLGNVNYGATGRAVGYDALTLRGGGWIYKLTHGTAFPLRETYRDQHMIQVGIDYYESQVH